MKYFFIAFLLFWHPGGEKYHSFLKNICKEKVLNWERYSFTQPKMGTLFTIILYAENGTIAEGAAAAAFAKIDSLNQILSDYIPESEINRLSQRSGSDEWVPVSDDLFQVLRLSGELSNTSGNAFDISLGPLIKLWRRAVRQQKLPATVKIREAMNRTGSRNILLDEENKTVKLLLKGMELDAGAIGKGYALDEAMKVLARWGVEAALIDGGGDILTSQPPPGKLGWLIDVNMGKGDGGVSKNVLLKNMAIATSGNTFRFVEIDDEKYSHIVNPATGMGITDQYFVSVIAENGAIADGLATALSVLGPEKGSELVKKYKNAAAIISSPSSGTWYSDGFMDYLSNDAQQGID